MLVKEFDVAAGSAVRREGDNIISTFNYNYNEVRGGSQTHCCCCYPSC